RRLIGLYAELGQAIGRPVPELNLGGGFGIAYTSAQAEDAPDIRSLAAELANIVAEGCTEAGIALPKLAFEPGRYIVGPAGVTLYTVGTTKQVPLAEPEAGTDGRNYAQRLYVSVDGGMSDNARTA